MNGIEYVADTNAVRYLFNVYPMIVSDDTV